VHATILTVHIAMGSLGVLSGAAALMFAKGSGPHRAVGTVFVLAMVAMAATASILETMKPEAGSVVGGLMTIYFIVTGWMAGRRKDGGTGAFEIGAFVILRGGLVGAQRVARHLWRMCFGLFIAVGSFAAQGSTVLPPPLRGELSP